MSEIIEATQEEPLSPQREAFCRYYTQNTALFGNGTLSYAEAYKYELDTLSKEAVYETDEQGIKKIIEDSPFDRAYNVCSTESSKLLRNPKIDKRVIELLNDMLREEVVDARLAEIIKSGEDKDSIQAIKEFNKLKQRIVERKDITTNGHSIGGFNFIRADDPISGQKA